MFEPGDIVLVPFPFTDLSAAKSRPALVMTRGDYNKTSEDLILCGITSNLANSSHSVLLAQADLESGTLPKPSRVKADKVVTLKQEIVKKRVGRLKATAMAQVMKEFEALFP
ncbi:MAG TPA: type II toxin-antitoxin system PemK/MazF family toxin [Candidatus Thermoplasmatota archaeon]|nr:type II toxin-antitoxin system PemK/MazF family toxin [Candidatus Thermoplasmatota archaeon]